MTNVNILLIFILDRKYINNNKFYIFKFLGIIELFSVFKFRSSVIVNLKVAFRK